MDSLAAPWVRKALKSDDAEVRMRANLILRKISDRSEAKTQEEKE